MFEITSLNRSYDFASKAAAHPHCELESKHRALPSKVVFEHLVSVQAKIK